MNATFVANATQKQVNDCISRSMATRLAKGQPRKLKRVYYG